MAIPIREHEGMLVHLFDHREIQMIPDTYGGTLLTTEPTHPLYTKRVAIASRMRNATFTSG